MRLQHSVMLNESPIYYFFYTIFRIIIIYDGEYDYQKDLMSDIIKRKIMMYSVNKAKKISIKEEHERSYLIVVTAI